MPVHHAHRPLTPVLPVVVHGLHGRSAPCVGQVGWASNATRSKESYFGRPRGFTSVGALPCTGRPAKRAQKSRAAHPRLGIRLPGLGLQEVCLLLHPVRGIKAEVGAGQHQPPEPFPHPSPPPTLCTRTAHAPATTLSPCPAPTTRPWRTLWVSGAAGACSGEVAADPPPQVATRSRRRRRVP